MQKMINFRIQIWLGGEKYLAQKFKLSSFKNDISIFWEEFFVLPFSTSSTIQIVPISNMMGSEGQDT